MNCFDSKKKESLSLKALICQEMVKQGIFLAPLNAVYLSYSHSTDDIEKTLTALDSTCSYIKSNISNDNYTEHLEGNLPKTIWVMKLFPVKKK